MRRATRRFAKCAISAETSLLQDRPSTIDHRPRPSTATATATSEPDYEVATGSSTDSGALGHRYRVWKMRRGSRRSGQRAVAIDYSRSGAQWCGSFSRRGAIDRTGLQEADATCSTTRVRRGSPPRGRLPTLLPQACCEREEGAGYSFHEHLRLGLGEPGRNSIGLSTSRRRMPASLRVQGHDGDAAPYFVFDLAPRGRCDLWPSSATVDSERLGQSPAHLGRTGFRDSDPAFAHGARVLAGRQPQVGLDLVGAFESSRCDPAPRQSGPPSQGPRREVVISNAGRCGSASAICSSSWSAKAICTLSVSRLTEVSSTIKGQPSGCLSSICRIRRGKVSVFPVGTRDQLGAQITAARC